MENERTVLLVLPRHQRNHRPLHVIHHWPEDDVKHPTAKTRLPSTATHIQTNVYELPVTMTNAAARVHN